MLYATRQHRVLNDLTAREKDSWIIIVTFYKLETKFARTTRRRCFRDVISRREKGGEEDVVNDIFSPPFCFPLDFDHADVKKT